MGSIYTQFMMGGRYTRPKIYSIYTWFILTWCFQPRDRPQKHTRYILNLYSIYPHPSQNILDLYLIYTIWHGIYVVFIEDISSMLGEYKSSINRGWTSSIYYLFRFIMLPWPRPRGPWTRLVSIGRYVPESRAELDKARPGILDVQGCEVHAGPWWAAYKNVEEGGVLPAR